MENSFATTVATPAKCVGRDAPSIADDTPATAPGDAPASGYISSLVRAEQQRHAGRDRLGRVALEVARVGAEVLAGAELQRVHEDRGDDEPALGRGPRMSETWPSCR